MILFFPGEIFKEITIEHKQKYRYAVSNLGRLVSFSDEIKNGRLLKGSLNNGFSSLHFKASVNGKMIHKQYAVHHLVAQLFLAPPQEGQQHLLHLDYRKDNNDVRNLKWATSQEKIAHYIKNPAVKLGREKMLRTKAKSDGRKLTITQVIRLKKILSDPNRKTRIKILAKQFGISEMQIFRIKSGENWGHIQI